MAFKFLRIFVVWCGLWGMIESIGAVRKGMHKIYTSPILERYGFPDGPDNPIPDSTKLLPTETHTEIRYIAFLAGLSYCKITPELNCGPHCAR